MIETYFDQDVTKPVKVRYLDGNVFSLDNNGNKVGVRLYDGTSPVNVSGTISANVIRADGATVSVSGSSSGNSAWVDIPQSALAVPGLISIIIKATSGSNITTLCAVVANVYQSSTDSTVDPGTIIPSIETLIAAIEAAVASIPADYSDLWESLAPTFSSSETYAIGQYVTYNGGLYRFTSAHTGSWASGDVTAVAIGGELFGITNNLRQSETALIDSVATELNSVISIGTLVSGYYLKSNNGQRESSSAWSITDFIEIDSTFEKLVYTYQCKNEGAASTIATICFYTDRVADYFVSAVSSEVGNTDTLANRCVEIPSTAKYFRLGIMTKNADRIKAAGVYKTATESNLIAVLPSFTKVPYIAGEYVSATGYSADSLSWQRTDWVDLKGAKKICLTVQTVTSSSPLSLVSAIAFYSDHYASTFISRVAPIQATTEHLEIQFVDVPANARFARASVRKGSVNDFFIKGLPSYKLMAGKTVAILGDSISTNGNTGVNSNVPEIVIQTEDVGVTLSAYLTYDDTHEEVDGDWVEKTLTIGNQTFTAAQIGQEITFTPAANDVGKCVGLPHNYNENGVVTWWEWARDEFGFSAIPVCWSGSSVTSHEYNVPVRMCSYAWHVSQIRKCGIRTPGTMNRTAPDVIIIYRGTNDMTHTPYALLTDNYFAPYNWEYPVNDTVSGGYGFKEAMCLTVKELREAYPNAQIMICTLNVFKRVNYTHFPTNNGINSLPQYNQAIREVAEFLGCGVIDFDKDGITFENCYSGGYITDSSTMPTHPSNKGHYVMGQRAISDIRNWFEDMNN